MEIVERHLARPQWVTSSRLLRVGESIEFDFFVPEGMEVGKLDVFELYLERPELRGTFASDDDLSWLDSLESLVLPLSFDENGASVIYCAEAPGNYLARWRVGEEVLYRYFAVIEDDWVVARFSTGVELDPRPTLHSTGIPLDYRLPVVRGEKSCMSYAGEIGLFDPDDPVFQQLLTYHRLYGDAVIPHLPDTPVMDIGRRVEYYGGLLEVVRDLIPDPNATRSARVSMRHGLDTGYTETFDRLGVNDHCGLEEANEPPWLGMPEFPYFSSPVDCRKVSQARGGSVVAHQWDFCGGWHFLGPATWHHQMSGGEWDSTEKCIRQGVAEAQRMADLSGHPAFLFPLFDGVFERGEPGFEWIERLQECLAFRLTKEYPLAFARSLDVADYYHRHFPVTPTTIFVSETDHLEYDRHWLVGWNNHRVSVTEDSLAWKTSIADLRVASPSGPVAHLTSQFAESPSDVFKDPLSTEYILVENQHRQVRFERMCPLPVWYFDYTEQAAGPNGSEIKHVTTPDVRIEPPVWRKDEAGFSTDLQITADAAFPNYAIVVWGVPREFDPSTWGIETTAKSHLLARNSKDENHLVLWFNLQQSQTIQVRLVRERC